MAKLEGVEKAAESIGITQLKDEQKDAIPINAQVIHAEITSCKPALLLNSSGTRKCDPLTRPFLAGALGGSGHETSI